MAKLVPFVLCLAAGTAVICLALLVPAHLRSVDADVLARAGRDGATLVDTGLKQGSAGIVGMHLEAANEFGLPKVELLRKYFVSLPPSSHSVWGVALPNDRPVISAFLRNPHPKLIEAQRRGVGVEVAAVFRSAKMTNLTHFAPAGTAAGQPFEAAILLTAALLENSKGQPALRSSITQMMGRLEPSEIESFYLDIITLGSRFTWDELSFLFERIETLGAVGRFAEAVRNFPQEIPLLFAVATLAGGASPVADYVLWFGENGLRDLALALGLGERAVKHVVKIQQPVWRPNFRRWFVGVAGLDNRFESLTEFVLNFRAAALLLKYLILSAGAFLVVYSAHFLRRGAEIEPRYIWFPQFRWARQGLFTCMFLMLLVLLGEPYLAQGEQEITPKPLWNFTFIAQALPSNTQTSGSNMNVLDQYTILALVMFLVIQGIIYIFCLLKLAEIRRQLLPSSTKLKLLENEENLFDAGLYCGLFGTVASLVFLALGIIKPSLMAAYSSTLFGILFVAVLKIFHVRPFKRRLLLDVDGQAA